MNGRDVWICMERMDVCMERMYVCMDIWMYGKNARCRVGGFCERINTIIRDDGETSAGLAPSPSNPPQQVAAG
jgi:hypothetical protein